MSVIDRYMPDFSSLAVRLSIRLSLIAFAVVGVILLALLIKLEADRDTLQDRSLEWQAKDIAAHLHRSAETGELVFQLPGELKDAYDRTDGQYLYLISHKDGKPLYQSRRGEVLAGHLPQEGGPRVAYFEFRDIELGQTFYGASLKFWIGPEAFVVQAAQGPGHPDVLADTIIEEFFEQQWWALLLFLVSILLTVVWTIRSSLAPVEQVARVARQLGPGSLHHRLDSTGVPTEVKPIVGAVNQALGEIEDGYRREREFTSNAAHQLRTPLTVLRGNLELANPDIEKIVDEVGSLERLVQQFLHLAQADNFLMVENTTVDLRRVATDVVSALAPYAISQGQQVELEAPKHSVDVVGSEAFVEVALRNLVENALAYSDVGMTVTVIVHDGVSVSVRDTGRGVSDAMKRRIFDRFWREDRSVEDGAGLGLAIVSQIVEAHGGTIRLKDNPGGGSVFTLTFVAATPTLNTSTQT